MNFFIKLTLVSLLIVGETQIQYINCQNINWGIQGGINRSIPKAVVVIDGVKESDAEIEIEKGKGLVGFNIKSFINLSFGQRHGVNIALSYELMRFRSMFDFFGKGIIHNPGLDIFYGFKPHKNWEVVVGTGVVYRFNKSTAGRSSDGKLNGTSVFEKVYWQSNVGLRYYLKDKKFIEFSMLIPPLKSATSVLDGPLEDKRFVDEQLQIIRLNIGVPLSL